jgi:hypothetical protein
MQFTLQALLSNETVLFSLARQKRQQVSFRSSKHEAMAICDELSFCERTTARGVTHSPVTNITVFHLPRKYTSRIDGLGAFFSAMTEWTEATKLLRSSRSEQRAKTFLITGCSR